MGAESVDPAFPACCALCPHHRPGTGACGHDLRQTLLASLDAERPCPVFTATKTAEMRRLSRALERTPSN